MKNGRIHTPSPPSARNVRSISSRSLPPPPPPVSTTGKASRALSCLPPPSIFRNTTYIPRSFIFNIPSLPAFVRTFDPDGPLARGPDQCQPREAQQADTNDRARADEERQEEENRRDSRVIQEEEGQVVLQPRRYQGGHALEVERRLLPDPEEDGGGAEVLAVEYPRLGLGERVLRALGEVRLGGREDVGRAGLLPDALPGARAHEFMLTYIPSGDE